MAFGPEASFVTPARSQKRRGEAANAVSSLVDGIAGCSERRTYRICREGGFPPNGMPNAQPTDASIERRGQIVAEDRDAGRPVTGAELRPDGSMSGPHEVSAGVNCFLWIDRRAPRR